jgi:hypothetical protein
MVQFPSKNKYCFIIIPVRLIRTANMLCVHEVDINEKHNFDVMAPLHCTPLCRRLCLILDPSQGKAYCDHRFSPDLGRLAPPLS